MKTTTFDLETTKRQLEAVLEERKKHLIRLNLDYSYGLRILEENGGEAAIGKAKEKITELDGFIKTEEKKGEKKDKAKILIWQAEMNEQSDIMGGMTEVVKAMRKRLEDLDFGNEADTKLIAYVEELLKDPLKIYEAFDKYQKERLPKP